MSKLMVLCQLIGLLFLAAIGGAAGTVAALSVIPGFSQTCKYGAICWAVALLDATPDVATRKASSAAQQDRPNCVTPAMRAELDRFVALATRRPSRLVKGDQPSSNCVPMTTALAEVCPDLLYDWGDTAACAELSQR
jgi:hypothetical protein